MDIVDGFQIVVPGKYQVGISGKHFRWISRANPTAHVDTPDGHPTSQNDFSGGYDIPEVGFKIMQGYHVCSIDRLQAIVESGG